MSAYGFPKPVGFLAAELEILRAEIAELAEDFAALLLEADGILPTLFKLKEVFGLS